MPPLKETRQQLCNPSNMACVYVKNKDILNRKLCITLTYMMF